ncbi:MAG: lipocalin-like domain-containing protein [Halobacteriales archaeon]|nr:lipocalin-like domain-containing protein [Halobacteriales archaeon]
MNRIAAIASATTGVLAGLLFVLPPEHPTASEVTERPAIQALSDEDRFVGNYELVSFWSLDDSGEQIDRNYVGRILYDEHGNMSAVGMPRDLPDRDRRSGDDQTVRAGFAYFGRFSLNTDEKYVTHHVRGSPMMPQWTGTDLRRYYELDGDLLRLSLRDDSGRTTAELTWRRF